VTYIKLTITNLIKLGAKLKAHFRYINFIVLIVDKTLLYFSEQYLYTIPVKNFYG